jgi:hypothetical protein
MNQDRSISKVTDYRLDQLGSKPSRGRDISLCHNVQSSSGTHLTAYAMGIEVSFLVHKETEHEDD